MSKKIDKKEEIPLFHASRVVSSLAGAFGHGLRETRITAMLGYIIANNPGPWLKFFSFTGEPKTVTIENYQALNRSDIEIKTDTGTGLIEAKIDSTDPVRQIAKYKADWVVMLTSFSPAKKHIKVRGGGAKYVKWPELLPLLQKEVKSGNRANRFVANDLIQYLEEHRMVKTKEAVEIYAREIGNEMTLEMFLMAHLYCCHYEQGSRLPDALYFAPHFSKSISASSPGIQYGISYVAQIKELHTVTSWEDLLAVCKSSRKAHWVKRHLALLEQTKSEWDWESGRKWSVLLLGAPRLVFTPAIKKTNVQKGSGWLSKRFLSFDELFEAWIK